MTRRVLVTGGLGVNGAWVTRGLLDHGYAVTVIDNREDTSLLGAPHAQRIDFVQADICEESEVRGLFSGAPFDCVVHMAAAVGHKDIDPDPGRTFRINAQATVGLLEAASSAGTGRFIFASSRAVYGPLKNAHAHPVYEPVREDEYPHPGATYDLCKLVGEEFGKSFESATGMEFAALRFSTIYGPGKTQRHGRFGTISRIIEAPFHGEPVEIAHGGDQFDDLIYAGEAARGVIAAVAAPALPHAVYNISTGIGHTLNDVATAVKTHIPDAKITIGGGLNYLGSTHNYSGILSPELARRDLGFEASSDLTQAIGLYYAHLRGA